MSRLPSFIATLSLAIAAPLAGAQEQEPPKVVEIGPLAYPPQAQREQLEGTAVIRIRVLESGAAGDVGVVRSSGHTLLDAQALRMAQGARFTPARQQGQPVDAWVTLPIRFELRDALPEPQRAAPLLP